MIKNKKQENYFYSYTPIPFFYQTDPISGYQSSLMQ